MDHYYDSFAQESYTGLERHKGEKLMTEFTFVGEQLYPNRPQYNV